MLLNIVLKLADLVAMIIAGDKMEDIKGLFADLMNPGARILILLPLTNLRYLSEVILRRITAA
jgi:hypothetical protein